MGSERIPIFIWGEAVDDGTLAQAKNLANLPFARDHIALMPDAHVGYGMPIGGVLAAEGQVIPHAVGLDIGCGVRAWRTNIPAQRLLPARDEVLSEIARAVPVGFEWHKRSQSERTHLFETCPDIPALRAELGKAEKQVGSLGGGNHFIELSVDAESTVWAMIHSGSRNVGKQIAEHYDHAARAENRRSGSPVPPEWGLAHLPVDEELGAEYFSAMIWCLDFARENRRLMALDVQAALARHFPDVEPDDAVDVHHNYAAVEEHLGMRLVIHRKGAVRAEGLVVIPGSMGTASYLARGLCTPASFCSCSHGAGRAMGRKAAERALPVDSVLHELAEKDVVLRAAKRRDIAQEAPEAYKDIDEVMRWQSDLVTPADRLTPVGVVKG